MMQFGLLRAYSEKKNQIGSNRFTLKTFQSVVIKRLKKVLWAAQNEIFNQDIIRITKSYGIFVLHASAKIFLLKLPLLKKTKQKHHHHHNFPCCFVQWAEKVWWNNVHFSCWLVLASRDPVTDWNLMRSRCDSLLSHNAIQFMAIENNSLINLPFSNFEKLKQWLFKQKTQLTRYSVFSFSSLLSWFN